MSKFFHVGMRIYGVGGEGGGAYFCVLAEKGKDGGEKKKTLLDN